MAKGISKEEVQFCARDIIETCSDYVRRDFIEPTADAVCPCWPEGLPGDDDLETGRTTCTYSANASTDGPSIQWECGRETPCFAFVQNFSSGSRRCGFQNTVSIFLDNDEEFYACKKTILDLCEGYGETFLDN
jgi:hypothetical protein